VTSFAYAASTNECVTNIQEHVGRDEDVSVSFIDLSYCNLNDEDLPQVVAFLNKNPDIVAALFIKNNIHAKGAQYLSQLTATRWLAVGGNYLGDEGAAALANNSVVEFLLLHDNQITDEGVVALAKNKKLHELALSGNLVGDKGAVLLAANTNIQDLSLDANRIGDEGAIALANAKHLSILILSANRIGDAGALAFASSVRSQSLWLEINDNNISESAMNQLRQNKSIDLFDPESDEYSTFKSKAAHNKNLGSSKNILSKKQFRFLK
jgi:hypothetical protein